MVLVFSVTGILRAQEDVDTAWREAAEALSAELAAVAQAAEIAESDRSALLRELDAVHTRVVELERLLAESVNEAALREEQWKGRLASEGDVREELWKSVEHWRREAGTWRERYAEANRVIEQGAEQREAAETRAADLEAELNRLAGELENRNERLGEVERLLGEAVGRADSASAAVGDLREQLEAERQAIAMERERWNAEREEMAARLAETAEAASQAGEILALQAAAMNRLVSVREAADRERDAVAQTVDVLKGRLINQLELEAAQTGWMRRAEESQKEAEAVRRERDELESKLRSVEDERVAIETALASTRRDSEGRGWELEEVRSTVGMLRTELEEAAERLDVQEATATEFQVLLDATEAEVQRLGGIVFNVDPVVYGLNASSIADQRLRLLTQVRDVLEAAPGMRFRLSGHTCDIGAPEANLELSRKRAESLKEYLVSQGLPQERFEAVGYGEERPIADNASEEGRRSNRRVEVEMLTGEP